jgi:hypothetical protein
MIISLIYYWIKNHIKPVELPTYRWFDKIVTFSNMRNQDNQADIKFYATKNWVEIYLINSSNVDYCDSNLISRNNRGESLIIPKWKVVSYEPYSLKQITNSDTDFVMDFVGISKNDYERYKEWHKK